MTEVSGDTHGDLIVFCRTLALLGGAFVSGGTWSLSPSLSPRTRLTHTCTAVQRLESP